MSHWKYLKYVVRHKWFVFVAGIRTSAPIWRLLIHDWSKLLPCEWVPYTAYFYGKPPVQGPHDRPNHALTVEQWKATGESRFNVAWLHHQHTNKHHWQHWILRNDDGTIQALKMPKKYTLEMVADWMGAGRAITGQWEAAEWYMKNRHRMELHSETRAFVEATLNIAAEIGNQRAEREGI